MRELADMVISRANITDTPVTNLQLQKVMYFLLAFMVNGADGQYRQRAERIFSEGNLQAWPYGPVDKPTYEKYKIFKDKPIKEEINYEVETDKTLDGWIDELLKINVFNLVRLSHEHEFWKQSESQIKLGSRPSYSFDNLIGIV
ncbi:Panacea domain-containing protein [Staphylococcus hominis]|uniref:Panacea domain-containing protein n=1 Tax=Staphylococcus hominis TaxID=1290 RepID=UPI0030C0D641